MPELKNVSDLARKAGGIPFRQLKDTDQPKRDINEITLQEVQEFKKNMLGFQKILLSREKFRGEEQEQRGKEQKLALKRREVLDKQFEKTLQESRFQATKKDIQKIEGSSIRRARDIAAQSNVRIFRERSEKDIAEQQQKIQHNTDRMANSITFTNEVLFSNLNELKNIANTNENFAKDLETFVKAQQTGQLEAAIESFKSTETGKLGVESTKIFSAMTSMVDTLKSTNQRLEVGMGDAVQQAMTRFEDQTLTLEEKQKEFNIFLKFLQKNSEGDSESLKNLLEITQTDAETSEDMKEVLDKLLVVSKDETGKVKLRSTISNLETTMKNSEITTESLKNQLGQVERFQKGQGTEEGLAKAKGAAGTVLSAFGLGELDELLGGKISGKIGAIGQRAAIKGKEILGQTGIGQKVKEKQEQAMAKLEDKKEAIRAKTKEKKEAIRARIKEKKDVLRERLSDKLQQRREKRALKRQEKIARRAAKRRINLEKRQGGDDDDDGGGGGFFTSLIGGLAARFGGKTLKTVGKKALSKVKEGAVKLGKQALTKTGIIKGGGLKGASTLGKGALLKGGLKGVLKGASTLGIKGAGIAGLKTAGTLLKVATKANVPLTIALAAYDAHQGAKLGATEKAFGQDLGKGEFSSFGETLSGAAGSFLSFGGLFGDKEQIARGLFFGLGGKDFRVRQAEQKLKDKDKKKEWEEQLKAIQKVAAKGPGGKEEVKAQKVQAISQEIKFKIPEGASTNAVAMAAKGIALMRDRDIPSMEAALKRVEEKKKKIFDIRKKRGNVRIGRIHLRALLSAERVLKLNLKVKKSAQTGAIPADPDVEGSVMTPAPIQDAASQTKASLQEVLKTLPTPPVKQAKLVMESGLQARTFNQLKDQEAAAAKPPPPPVIKIPPQRTEKTGGGTASATRTVSDETLIYMQQLED